MTDKAPSKSDQVRALREQRAERNSGKSSGGGLGVQKPGSNGQGTARDRVTRPAVAGSNPVAKEPKAKAGSTVTKSGRPAKGSGRLSAGRTAQDRGKLARPAAVAIEKRGPGRPKVDGKRPWELAGVSRRTWYRKRAEGNL